MLLQLLFACSGAPSTLDGTPAVTGRPDVVVVTLDTTRADRLGAYGYEAARTDAIDRLAEEGVRFESAYSPLPLTIPAHATLFTGLLPFHHHVRDNGDNVLADELTTLAEVFRDEGWSTGASVAAFVTTRRWGFSQGFDAYFDSLPQGDGADPNYWHTERSGDQVVDDALSWLASQGDGRPVFLWVHLYDAHRPFEPREPYAGATKDAYDAELAFVDDQVGRLVEAFQGRNALFALVGDHGEALGEHGEPSHGLYAYNATQRVPWILSGAGLTRAVVEEPVSTADLTPTLLTMLSLPVPEGLDGRPQPGGHATPYAESYALADRFRLAPHRAVVEGDLKLIATPKPELYDVAADPGELVNLAASRPDDVARLTATLDALGATPPSASRAAVDAETLGQLAALGYVTGGGGDDADPLTLPDAKDYPGLVAGAAALDEEADLDPAASLVRVDALLAQKPDAFELRMRKLALLTRLGRAEEARLFAEETAALFPKRARVWLTLATLATVGKDPARGLEYARKAVEAEPGDAAAREAVVRALFALGRDGEARAEGEAAIAADADNHGVAALLGQSWLAAGDYEKAESYLRIAIAGPDPRRGARFQLAGLALAAGARADATDLLEAEVADYPGNRGARRLLSRMYSEDQRWLDQLAHIGFLAHASPDDPAVMGALAQCLFNLRDYDAAREALDTALHLAPEDADLLLLNANLLAKEGKREEALQALEAARAADAARRSPP